VSGAGASSTDRAIWAAVAAIPAGCVSSYGEVAANAGLANGARAVAPALRRAPVEPALPWHRVVNASGRISLPGASRQYRRQRERLEAEGVVFVNGRIDLRRYGTAAVLDRLLWAPEEQ